MIFEVEDEKRYLELNHLVLEEKIVSSKKIFEVEDKKKKGYLQLSNSSSF